MIVLRMILRMQTGDERLPMHAGVEGLPKVFENETEMLSQSYDLE